MKSTSNTLQQLVLKETDDGLRVVRFLVDVMDADVEGVKVADRTGAARELLDRCFGRPFTASDMLIDRILRVIEETAPDDGEAADD